ncbi:MAG: type II toxin-antitoxin system HicB family antitoxin [Candidatus Aenigmarchaeota archaeon]|nr:type II toxin-antitoxin system HicB family antitoxin [Candidatus Aenigmarchaeota archaeon]
MDFKIVLEHGEDGWLTSTCPSLPGCISQGKTVKEAVENIKEAIELHLETLAEDGVPITTKNKNSKELLVSVKI